MADNEDRPHSEPPEGRPAGLLEGLSTRTKLICGVVVSLVGAVTAVMGLLPHFTKGSDGGPVGADATPPAFVSIVDLQTNVEMADVFAGIPAPQERRKRSRAECDEAAEIHYGGVASSAPRRTAVIRPLGTAAGADLIPVENPHPRPVPAPTPSPTPAPYPVPPPGVPNGVSPGDRGIGIDLAAVVATREGQLVRVYAVLEDDSGSAAGPRIGPIALRCIPRDGEDSWQDPVFVPVPRAGEWSVRLELWDETGTRIARSETRDFTQESG
jgi:hypothetical protein